MRATQRGSERTSSNASVSITRKPLGHCLHRFITGTSKPVWLAIFTCMCVDYLTRYVVLAPLKDKTAAAVAHALVTHLFCPFSTPRVILSDNGAEFRNAVVAEICSQPGISQTFTAAYHPAWNGLVERANRKILEVLRSIVNYSLDNWEDWFPHIAASINSSVNDSTGKLPLSIYYLG